ncbi:MAG TPA: DNA polymerase III subunit chi [Rubrivivax sp.]|nr:DNA polymerase III subunit chi [Rubrivivax sp.]
MPQVEFHSGVEAPLHFACRLLRKAWRQGVAVVVTAPSQTLQALDRELWTFEAQEFVPHLRVRPGQVLDAALRRTPIWLCEAEAPSPGPAVLLNLGADTGAAAQRYQRIIEIVPEDAQLRQRARARWRAYEASGWPIKHHAKAPG